MDRISAIQHFIRVADLGSFTQAANLAGVPKATISNAISQLENQLGAQLLHRTTRKVSLTHDGQTFYDRSIHLLLEFDDLHSLFQQTDAQLTGIIRVDMPIGLSKNVVCPALPAFLQSHPQLNIQLSSTDRRVDLIREGFDCVVRVGKLEDSDLIARPLGHMPIISCVSPAYIAQYGEPDSLESLGNHKLVHYQQNLSVRDDNWEYWDGKNYQTIKMKGAITVNNSEAYTAACIAGLGIIQVPAMGAKRLIEQGQLVHILKQYQAEAMPVNLLYANRHNLSKRVKIFMDWLSQLINQYTE
ncbi:LysR family transcriptional regulator [Neptunicella marina]|uniref:LysR family transcriptional regulator n=1 Tax=Neptunicella marina TaxID=2125989 RepID=A0A8J6IXM4_9ALTE|nr:LysR family transcriptional regulator [Neptunicella marina]MBC3767246.1 LysR family transcriptional regulator [Neptunicella marina]